MGEIEQIYNELIMDHSVNSPYKKKMEAPTACLLGHNPNCGDEIKLEIKIKDGLIEDACFSGQGCAISQSSTSIMIETLKGKTVKEARKIINIFVKMIKREHITDRERKLLSQAEAFENVSNMPARVKCALLSWHTMEELLGQDSSL